METPEISVDSRASPARRCYAAIIMLRLPPHDHGLSLLCRFVLEIDDTRRTVCRFVLEIEGTRHVRLHWVEDQRRR